jgi:hypothetical protein
MSQRLLLEVVAGPLKGQTIGVPANGTLLIGRLPECGLSIPQDLTVSRQHFRIDFRWPVCALVHLSQTGETRVNDVPVSTANLRDQDVISFGAGNTLRVHLEDCPTGAEITAPAGRVDKSTSSGQFTKTAASCGWNVYRGLDPKPDFTELLEIVGRQPSVYALIDFQRTGQPIPPELIDPKFTFSWIAPELQAKFSPMLVSKSVNPGFVELLRGGWGRDGIVCFGSTQSVTDVLAHWKKAMGVVDDQPPVSMTAYHWPSLLNQILTCQSPAQVAVLLAGLTWILVEAPDAPGKWKLYADDKMASILTSAGLVLVEPSATAH